MLESALVMSASVPFARIHWYVYPGLVSPSASVMPVVTAVSVWPTCAVPVMVGAPIAGSFPAVTSMVIVLATALSTVPSFTLKVKVV